MHASAHRAAAPIPNDGCGFDAARWIADESARLDREVENATEERLVARDEPVRQRASAKLRELAAQRHELDARIGAFRAVANAERAKGTRTSAACLANPLATGCN